MTCDFASSFRRRLVGQTPLLLVLLVAGIYLALPLPLLGDQISLEWLSGLDHEPSWRLALPWCCGLVAVVVALISSRFAGEKMAVLAAAMVFVSLLAVRSPSDIAFFSIWLCLFLGLSFRREFRWVGFAYWLFCLAAQVGLAIEAYATGFWQMHTPNFGARASGFYGTPNVVYPVVIIAMFTFIAALLAVGRKWGRCVLVALAALALLVLVLTFTRAGWLGACVGFVALAVRARQKFRWLAIALSISFLLGAIFIRTHGGFVGSGGDSSGRNRPLIWKHAVSVWLRSPWIGHGFSAFAREEVVGETPPGLPYLPGEPKNLYLNILVEQGLLGLGLYGVFFMAALSTSWRLWKNANAPPVDRAIAAALFPSLVAILVAGLVDTPAFGPLMRVPGTATLLVFIGMVAGADADLRCAAKPPL